MDKKVMLVGRKRGSSGKYQPKIRVSGFWLTQIGFAPDTLVTVDYEYGHLVLKTQGIGRETYLKFAKQAIHENLGIIQVRGHLREKRTTPNFEISAKWLNDMGFETGTVIILEPEQDLIHIRRLEVQATTLTKSYIYG